MSSSHNVVCAYVNSSDFKEFTSLPPPSWLADFLPLIRVNVAFLLLRSPPPYEFFHKISSLSPYISSSPPPSLELELVFPLHLFLLSTARGPSPPGR